MHQRAGCSTISHEHRPHISEVFEWIGGQRRPTWALLRWLWPDGGTLRNSFGLLQAWGLAEVINAGAPRQDWIIQPAASAWEVACGHGASGVRHLPAEDLPSVDDLVLPDETAAMVRRAMALLRERSVGLVVAHGPQHNGRRTTLGALARSLGMGVIEHPAAAVSDEARAGLHAALGVMLNALPVAVLDLAPG